MFKRSYMPREKHPKEKVYHNTLDRLLLQSDILNGAGKTPSVHSVLYDNYNIKTELYHLVGDENGVTFTEGVTRTASIPFVKIRLQECEDKFKRYCRQQVLQGNTKPKDWPSYLLHERLTFEAKLLLCEEEVQELQRRLKIVADKEKVISDANVLKDGPVGAGKKLKDNKLVSIDNMSVKEIKVDPSKKNSETILIIDCDHPKAKNFDGYSVEDYRNFIVLPWKLACSKQSVINKEKAKKEGVRYELLSRGQRLGTNAPVGSFPDSCKNYKELITESK